MWKFVPADARKSSTTFSEPRTFVDLRLEVFFGGVDSASESDFASVSELDLRVEAGGELRSTCCTFGRDSRSTLLAGAFATRIRFSGRDGRALQICGGSGFGVDLEIGAAMWTGADPDVVAFDGSDAAAGPLSG